MAPASTARSGGASSAAVTDLTRAAASRPYTLRMVSVASGPLTRTAFRRDVRLFLSGLVGFLTRECFGSRSSPLAAAPADAVSRDLTLVDVVSSADATAQRSALHFRLRRPPTRESAGADD